jgi:hypothetical protein
MPAVNVAMVWASNGLIATVSSNVNKRRIDEEVSILEK